MCNFVEYFGNSVVVEFENVVKVVMSLNVVGFIMFNKVLLLSMKL